jgi:hypothetical protein
MKQFLPQFADKTQIWSMLIVNTTLYGFKIQAYCPQDSENCTLSAGFRRNFFPKFDDKKFPEEVFRPEFMKSIRERQNFSRQKPGTVAKCDATKKSIFVNYHGLRFC